MLKVLGLETKPDHGHPKNRLLTQVTQRKVQEDLLRGDSLIAAPEITNSTGHMDLPSFPRM